MNATAAQTIASTISVLVGGGLTLFGVYLSNYLSKSRERTRWHSSTVPELTACRFEVSVWQKELRRAEAIIFANSKEAELLRLQTPANYIARLHTCDEEIKYHRKLAEQHKRDTVTAMVKFHKLLVEIQQRLGNHSDIKALCNTLLEYPMPAPPQPPVNAVSSDEVEAWRLSYNQEVDDSILESLLKPLDKLCRLLNQTEHKSKEPDNSELRVITLCKGIWATVKD
jgi:hypothetical protein